MTAKEKQGFGLYFLFAFGMAWLCQVGGCMALLQQNNAVLYQLALIVTMFCPLLAVLLVQKAFLRQPTGIGWKVQGKRRFWLAAWFGPAVLTLLGAVLYFAVFPSRLDFSCSWLVAAYGGEMDAQTLRSLMRFREDRDLHFDDITPQFALAYETWLREQRLCRNSTSFYLRVVRTLYNKAVAAGLTPDRQPFRAVYTGIDKTTKRAVGMADIRRIKEADLHTAARMEFARDMFLLSFYLRGIAPIDLAFLRKTDICHGYLHYARHKTGQRMRVLVEPEIQRLFNKYAAPGTNFLLPLITREDGTERDQYRNSTCNINRHLKRLSARLHLSAPLTLYVARHSWASIAQSEHIPIGVICGAMGHDSETTTQIYLASIQTRQIDEANNLLISRL